MLWIAEAGDGDADDAQHHAAAHQPPAPKASSLAQRPRHAADADGLAAGAHRGGVGEEAESLSDEADAEGQDH